MAISQVIKYEGDNSTFIWKYPGEGDFNSTTQLIVHESQEAIFFMNGQALDLFGPGRHTLETQNIPKIGKFLKRTTGETPFHCDVYFINKTVQMAVKWGTDSKIRFIDPNMGIPLEIGACGEMNLEVADSRKLLLKLVGTTNGIAWGDSGAGFTKSIQNCFRPLISTAVKAHLVSAIKEQNINILEIDENLEALSEVLRKSIIPGFEEYGLTIPQFYITNVALPENDKNLNKLRELHTISLQTKYIQAERQIELERQTTMTEVARRQAERDLIDAKVKAEAEKMKGFAEAEVYAAKGYTGKDALAAEVQMAYAEGIGNMTVTGGGSIAGDVVGLGVGMAAAGAIAPKLGEMFGGGAAAPAKEEDEKCAKCGASLPKNAKFCLECGEKVVAQGTIVCPKCGNTVAKGKFCPECGHKFITACPKCGTEVAPGAKFCPECGEKL